MGLLTYLHNKQDNKEAIWSCGKIPFNFWWWVTTYSFLWGAWTQLHQTWRGHRAIITAFF